MVRIKLDDGTLLSRAFPGMKKLQKKKNIILSESLQEKAFSYKAITVTFNSFSLPFHKSHTLHDHPPLLCLFICYTKRAEHSNP